MSDLSDSSPPPRLRSLSIIARVLLVLAAFGLAFVPLRASQDEWWHLKTGQWIWEHKSLPTNDIFTYTGEDLRWYNHEWLSQLIFYGTHSLGEAIHGDGMFGLIFFKSLVVAGVFMLVAMLGRQRGLSWAAACVIALVAADISRRTIHPRPPIFSYLLMATELLMLYGWKQGRVQFRTLWLLVPITVVWANLHGMVLLSFLATGAFAGGELLENTRRWWIKSKTCPAVQMRRIFSRSFWGLSLLTVALIFAAMAQPSGYHLFFLGRNFTADPLLQEIILEMKPTPGPFVLVDPELGWWRWDNLVARPPGFWTPWLGLLAIALLLLRNRGRMTYGADYLLLGFFAYQGTMHWRLLPLFAIAAAGPAGGLLRARLIGISPRAQALEGPVFLGALVLLVGWFNFTVAEPPPQTFLKRNMQMLRGETANLSDYPAPLYDFIIEADLPPRMFGDSNYCGYAMWRLSPEHYKVFTDNRFDLFGSEFIRQERVVHYALERGDMVDGEVVKEGWRDILNRYEVNFLVFRPVDRPHLFRALTRGQGWRLVYYFIPPEADRSGWPLNGNHVWVRDEPVDDVDAAAIASRSEGIFKRQFPEQVPPSRVWDMVKRASAADAAREENGSTSSGGWRVPL